MRAIYLSDGVTLDVEGLRGSFGHQDGNKAPGVDGMRKADYAEGLEGRLAEVPLDSAVWAIGPSRRGGYTFPRGMEGGGRWGFPVLRTELCKTGSA